MIDRLKSYYQARHLWLAGTLLVLLSLGMLYMLVVGIGLSGSKPPSVLTLIYFLIAVLPGVTGVGFLFKKLWAWWLFLIAIPFYLIWLVWVVRLPDLITHWDEYQQIYNGEPRDRIEIPYSPQPVRK